MTNIRSTIENDREVFCLFNNLYDSVSNIRSQKRYQLILNFITMLYKASAAVQVTLYSYSISLFVVYSSINK
jgi:hypothetical protein